MLPLNPQVHANSSSSTDSGSCNSGDSSAEDCSASSQIADHLGASFSSGPLINKLASGAGSAIVDSVPIEASTPSSQDVQLRSELSPEPRTDGHALTSAAPCLGIPASQTLSPTDQYMEPTQVCGDAQTGRVTAGGDSDARRDVRKVRPAPGTPHLQFMAGYKMFHLVITASCATHGLHIILRVSLDRFPTFAFAGLSVCGLTCCTYLGGSWVD